MNFIDKINELTNHLYTIEISSNTEVCIDDYNEGELKVVNYWENDNDLFHTESENLKEELTLHLKNYIEDTLFIENAETVLKEGLENYDDNTYFYLSQLVDAENTTPSTTQIENWKKSNLTLYVQNIEIVVKINGKAMPADLLLEIITSDK